MSRSPSRDQSRGKRDPPAHAVVLSVDEKIGRTGTIER
jgi:hypothetical protein